MKRRRIMNHIILSGRLTKDPEIKKGKEDKEFYTFSIADNVSESVTCFYDCIAPKCSKKKGDLCVIDGRISYKDIEKDGIKRRYYSISGIVIN